MVTGMRTVPSSSMATFRAANSFIGQSLYAARTGGARLRSKTAAQIHLITVTPRRRFPDSTFSETVLPVQPSRACHCQRLFGTGRGLDLPTGRVERAKNHPFNDGNKRTALLATRAFLFPKASAINCQGNIAVTGSQLTM